MKRTPMLLLVLLFAFSTLVLVGCPAGDDDDSGEHNHDEHGDDDDSAG